MEEPFSGVTPQWQWYIHCSLGIKVGLQHQNCYCWSFAFSLVALMAHPEWAYSKAALLARDLIEGWDEQDWLCLMDMLSLSA